MEYYYILIDKQEKTLQLVKAESCQVTTEKKLETLLKLPCRFYLQKRYTLFFNDIEATIDRNKVYKYASKYTVLEGLL